MKKYIPILVYTLVLVILTAALASGATIVVLRAAELQSGESVTISMEEYRLLQSYEKLDVLRSNIHKYFYQDVDDELLSEGAAYGMVSMLGDPYSTYLSAEQMQALQQQETGEYIGVGATFLANPDTGLLTITRIYPNSPIASTDASVGDTLYSVNGEVVVGLDVTSITAMIKGDEGTELTIVLQRDNQVHEYTLRREKVEIIDVEYRMLDGDILLINLYAFSVRADKAFDEAIKYGKANNMKSLIVDLRGNGGGNGDIVKNIADQVLPEGVIFYTQDNQGNRTELKSSARHLGLPMVVLCNGGSASASEILIAAVQDYGVGTVVGTQTFGKAIGQTTLSLFSDGAGLYITTVTVHSPKGRNWQGEGLEPDVTVELPDELLANPLLLNDENDLQLQQAISILQAEAGQ